MSKVIVKKQMNEIQKMWGRLKKESNINKIKKVAGVSNKQAKEIVNILGINDESNNIEIK